MQMGGATMATPSPSSANERASVMPPYPEDDIVSQMTPEDRLKTSLNIWNKQAEEAKKRQAVSYDYQLRAEREERELLRQRYWKDKDKEREKAKDNIQMGNGPQQNSGVSMPNSSRPITQTGESRKRRHDGDDQYGREEFRQGFAEMNRSGRGQPAVAPPPEHARWLAYQQQMQQQQQHQQQQQMQHQQYQQSMMMQQQHQRNPAMHSGMNGHPTMPGLNNVIGGSSGPLSSNSTPINGNPTSINGAGGPMMMMMNNSPHMQPSTSSPHTIPSSSSVTQCSPACLDNVSSPHVLPSGKDTDDLSNLNTDQINLDAAVAQMTGSAIADLGNDDLFGDLMSAQCTLIPEQKPSISSPMSSFGIGSDTSGQGSQQNQPSRSTPQQQLQQPAPSQPMQPSQSTTQPSRTQSHSMGQQPLSNGSCNYGNPPITPTNGCTTSMSFGGSSIGAPLCTSTPVSTCMAGSSSQQPPTQVSNPAQASTSLEQQQQESQMPTSQRNPNYPQTGGMPPPFMGVPQGYPGYQEGMPMPGGSMMGQPHPGMSQQQFMMMRMQQQRSMQQQMMAQHMQQQRQGQYFGMHPMSRPDPRYMNPMMDPSMMQGNPRMGSIGMSMPVNPSITSPSYPQYVSAPMYPQYPMN
ncbi:unnamed protein product [Auanema sp. JU1783]|nr:unnamed protein product [Auanema sp. JU1783]